MAGQPEDPHQILGLSPGATPEQIRAAYLSAVKRYHPDRHRDNPLADLATRELAAINQAYAALMKDRRMPESPQGARAPAATGEASPPPGAAVGRGLLRGALALVGVLMVVVVVARALPVILRFLVAAGTAVAEAIDGTAGRWTAGAIAILLVAGLLVLLARRHRRQRRAR